MMANETKAKSKRRLTIVFDEKYADLFDYIEKEAADDDRDMDTWILRYLHDGLEDSMAQA